MLYLFLLWLTSVNVLYWWDGFLVLAAKTDKKQHTDLEGIGEYALFILIIVCILNRKFVMPTAFAYNARIPNSVTERRLTARNPN